MTQSTTQILSRKSTAHGGTLSLIRILKEKLKIPQTYYIGSFLDSHRCLALGLHCSHFLQNFPCPVFRGSSLCAIDFSQVGQSEYHRQEVAMEKLIARWSYSLGIACLAIAVIWKIVNVLRSWQSSAATPGPMVGHVAFMHASILLQKVHSSQRSGIISSL
jgi:hypothetical protein